MKKKELLKKCDSYTELFKNEENVDRNSILEFLDFAELHLPKNSNLAFEINQISPKDFSGHAKRIKDFIKTKGSKAITENKNILSEKSNVELIGIIFGIFIFAFWIGYWAKEFEVFSLISQTEKAISTSSSNANENVTNINTEITKSVNNVKTRN